jgi:Bacterial regulatory proteins, lacI family
MNGPFEPDLARCLFTLAEERLIDLKLLSIGPSIGNGHIELFHSMPIDEAAELARCGRILRDQDESAGFPIKPIDQRDLATIPNFKRQQFAQFRPERLRAARFRRMNQKMSWFIENQKIVLFMDNSRRNGIHHVSKRITNSKRQIANQPWQGAPKRPSWLLYSYSPPSIRHLLFAVSADGVRWSVETWLANVCIKTSIQEELERTPMTLFDLARELNVSISTISRTLSRPEMVAPVTREKVLAAVKQFGFQPNEIAR